MLDETSTLLRRRWSVPWVEVIASLVLLAGALLFTYPHIASWFSQKEQSRVTSMALEQLAVPPNNEETFRVAQLDKAHEYNANLASGAIFRAHENIATGSGSNSNETLAYNELLDTTGTGFMGRLKYDELKIDLPIYHGTSDDTLAKGVGHLEGTSLPVGGTDTRSVLTAHRGLPQATLFNDLNVAQAGDTFTISVLDQVLTYQVTETLVIEPDETEAILPVLDNDMVTLVTCTPLGINSHRILVNAERVAPTTVDDLVAGQTTPHLPGFPWWTIVLGATIAGTGTFIWRSGYRSIRSSS